MNQNDVTLVIVEHGADASGWFMHFVDRDDVRVVEQSMHESWGSFTTRVRATGESVGNSHLREVVIVGAPTVDTLILERNGVIRAALAKLIRQGQGRLTLDAAATTGTTYAALAETASAQLLGSGVAVRVVTGASSLRVA